MTPRWAISSRSTGLPYFSDFDSTVNRITVKRLNEEGQPETVHDGSDSPSAVTFEIHQVGEQLAFISFGRQTVVYAWNGFETAELIDERRIESFMVTDSALYFEGRGTAFMTDLKEDGRVDLNRLVTDLIEVDDEVFYFVEESFGGSRLMFGDPRKENPVMLLQFGDPLGLPGGIPRNLTAFDGQLFFVVDGPDANVATELWRSDGTPTGTERLTDFGDLPNGSLPSFLTDVGTALYFSAEDPARGREVYRFQEVGAEILGDVNSDGLVDSADIDAVFLAIRNGDKDPRFDLVQDGTVNQADADFLIGDIIGTVVGDVNLDGVVDFPDFLLLARSFNQQNALWSDGDFNGDGTVNIADFLALSREFGFGA